MQVVRLQYQHQLLAESLHYTKTKTNLDPEDDLEIDETPREDWSR